MPRNHSFQRNGVFKDFDMNFEINPLTGDIGIKKDANAITQSLRNLFNTNYYERAFDPELGCNLRSLLFQPADPITVVDIRSAIVETIQQHEPRVNISDIFIEDLSDMNAYNVRLYYITSTDPEPVQYEFILERLR